MSLRALTWALDECPTWLQPSERFVLVALADHVNDTTSEAWPAVGRLMRRTGLSRAAVKRALRVLVCARIIDRYSQAAPIARVPAQERPNLYVWHPEQAQMDNFAISVLVTQIRNGRRTEGQATFDGIDAEEAFAKHTLAKQFPAESAGSSVDPRSSVDPQGVQCGPPTGSSVDPLPGPVWTPNQEQEPSEEPVGSSSYSTTERNRATPASHSVVTSAAESARQAIAEIQARRSCPVCGDGSSSDLCPRCSSSASPSIESSESTA